MDMDDSTKLLLQTVLDRFDRMEEKMDKIMDASCNDCEAMKKIDGHIQDHKDGKLKSINWVQFIITGIISAFALGVAFFRG